MPVSEILGECPGWRNAPRIIDKGTSKGMDGYD